MEEFVFFNGKKLRKGYTTGSCAAAAAAAATMYLFHHEFPTESSINLPNQQNLIIPIASLEPGVDCCRALVVKDGGDDADITHGMLIGAEVTLNQDEQITISGGQGIGRVTKAGLQIPVGQAAINPVPRKMIEESVRRIIGYECGAQVVIFAPEGAEIAKQTMNSRLGIIGGISILGTTGIVTPMSEEGWKQAISAELAMKRNQGYQAIILCPGNYGEDFAVNRLKLNKEQIVSMSNFIGYVLNEVQRLEFKRILLVGHLGKFVKVAAGIFSTHSKDADARAEILIANLALLGMPLDCLREIDACTTTEAAGEIIAREGFEAVYQVIADKIKHRSEGLLRYRKTVPQIEVVLFSSQRGYLASTKPLNLLMEEWR